VLNLGLDIFNKNLYFKWFNYTFSTSSISVFCFKKNVGIQKGKTQEEEAVKCVAGIDTLIFVIYLK